MRQFLSFKAFKKCVRKYWKRHSTKRVDYIHGKRFTSYWTDKEFCYYVLSEPTELLSPGAYEKFNFQYDVERDDFEAISPTWASLMGKEVIATFDKRDDSVKGRFEGFFISNNSVTFLLDDHQSHGLTRLPMCWKLEEI